jgi:hypothetical protein
MEEAGTSETLVNFYHNTPRNQPEDIHLRSMHYIHISMQRCDDGSVETCSLYLMYRLLFNMEPATTACRSSSE